MDQDTNPSERAVRRSANGGTDAYADALVDTAFRIVARYSTPDAGEDTALRGGTYPFSPDESSAAAMELTLTAEEESAILPPEVAEYVAHELHVIMCYAVRKLGDYDAPYIAVWSDLSEGQRAAYRKLASAWAQYVRRHRLTCRHK